MLVGASVNDKGLVSDLKYQELVAANFNCIYPENGLKFKICCPEREEFDFAEADRAAAFARKHNLAIRGHCLIWHWGIPKWLTTAMPLEQRWLAVEGYMRAVLNRYPEINAWDVCNEAFDNHGYQRKHLKYLLGEDYIFRSFKLASAINPHLELFYCDNQVKFPRKWDAIFKLLSHAKDNDIPIHGVSMQVHSNILPVLSAERLAIEIDRFRSLGLKIHVPEIVVWDSVQLPRSAMFQTGIYKSLISTCIDARVDLFGFWSPFDVYGWVFDRTTQRHPGLWDINHHPKPVVGWLREKLGQHSRNTR